MARRIEPRTMCYFWAGVGLSPHLGTASTCPVGFQNCYRPVASLCSHFSSFDTGMSIQLSSTLFHQCCVCEGQITCLFTSQVTSAPGPDFDDETLTLSWWCNGLIFGRGRRRGSWERVSVFNMWEGHESLVMGGGGQWYLIFKMSPNDLCLLVVPSHICIRVISCDQENTTGVLVCYLWD